MGLQILKKKKNSKYCFFILLNDIGHFVKYLFLRRRECRHTCMSGGRGRKRERISSRLHPFSMEPRAGLDLRSHEIMT